MIDIEKGCTAPYVATISILLGITFGVAFAPEGSNQLVYVTEGLVLRDPGFLRADWWATETTGYHPLFAYLVAVLEDLGILKWSLALANICLIAVTGWLTFVLIRIFEPRRGFPVWLAFLTLFIGVVGGRSVADSYLFDESLQASSIATVATVVAILYFVRGQFLFSGLALAVAGFFHTNFLLLGFPVFGAAHLILGTRGLVRRCVLQLAPLLVVFAIDIPLILKVSGQDLAPEMRAEANRLIIEVAAPHHYRPRGFLTEFFPLVGWQVAALSVLGAVPGERNTRRNLFAVYLGLLVVVAVGTILTTVVSIDAVARLFVWRMAPFMLMCAHIVIVLAAARLFLEEPAELRKVLTPKRVVGFGLGVAMVLAFFLRRMPVYDPRLWISLAGAVVIAIAWVRLRLDMPGLGGIMSLRSVVAILLVALFLGRLPSAVSVNDGNASLAPKFNLLYSSGPDRARAELYRWARTTASDSRFLIPPLLSGFRLHGGRAVVVDWKGRPFRPDELLEWHRRIIAITGLARWRRLDELDLAYNQRSDTEILHVVRSYKANFIVLNRRAGERPAFGRPVFENKLFRVYRTPAASGQRTGHRNVS